MIMDMDIYESVVLNRNGARKICFSIVNDIEAYCELHADEFQQFLEAENAKEKEVKK